MYKDKQKDKYASDFFTKSYARFWDYLDHAGKELYYNEDSNSYCFANQSRKKDALDYINRAYSILVSILRECYVPHCNWSDETGYFKCKVYSKYSDAPMSLHQVRLEKHYDIFVTPNSGNTKNAKLLQQLVLKRNLYKNDIEVVKPRPKTQKEQEISDKVIKTFEEMFKLRKAQFDRAIEVGKHFNYLPVYAKPHRVTNEYGTTFTRCFYYLHGNLTPLNILVAAAQKLEDDKKGAK